MKKTQIFGNATGVTVIKENPSTPAKGVSARITSAFNTGFLFSDIRRAYLCNTEVESVSGTELGWIADSLTLVNLSITPGLTYTETADRIRITRNGDAQVGYVSTDTASVVTGENYSLVLQILGVSAGASAFFSVTHGGGGSILGGTYSGGATTNRTPFVATGAGNGKVRFSFSTARGSNPAAALAGDWIEISKTLTVTKVIADRSYKAAGANIYGTLVKSPVA